MEGVEVIGPISDDVIVTSNVDAPKNLESAMSGTDGTIDDKRGKAGDDVKLELKETKALDGVLKKEVKITSNSRKEEGRRAKMSDKGRAERVKKTKKKEVEMKWRALEPARKIKKLKKEKKKDKSAKLSSNSIAKALKDKLAVDVSLDKNEEANEKSNQTNGPMMTEKSEVVNSTLPPISIDLEDAPILEPGARKSGEPKVTFEKNETAMKTSTKDGVKADEDTTQPGAFWSFYNSKEDLNLTFLNDWMDEIWFESVPERPIVNTTERVLVPPSSELR